MRPDLTAPTTPNLDPCSVLIGPAKSACQAAGNIVHGTQQVASFVSDPLGSIATDTVKAASWVIDKLAAVVQATTGVDFANPGFLRTYAVVFGASTFLILILWVLAVAKRAVRGVPVSTAVGEAVGFLWLAVAASAFTPLALSLVVGLTDQLTAAIAGGTGADTTRFLHGISTALSPGTGGGGPVVVIVLSLLALLAAATIWVELLIRAAMLYIGGVLGAAVYAGLVDRDLWRHVRRWAGIMVAVDLAKPVLIIVLALAAAVSTTSTTSTPAAGTSDSFSAALSGMAIMFLSIFTSAAIYKFVPHFGDDMASIHHQRKNSSNAGPAAVVDGPAAQMRRGMAVHGARGGAGTGGAARSTTASGGAGAAGAAGVVGVAAGVAAHAGSAAVRRGVDRISPRPPQSAPSGTPAGGRSVGRQARQEGGPR